MSLCGQKGFYRQYRDFNTAKQDWYIHTGDEAFLWVMQAGDTCELKSIVGRSINHILYNISA